MALYTVFTATHQRRHTLPRVLRSLVAQTLQDFEWVVVDDGSTDGTREWIAEAASLAGFPVRYQWQPHGGKHVAINQGLRLARGEFFTIVDSDDELVPTALERLAHHWRTIPATERHRYSGVVSLCREPSGGILGNRFPSDVMDSDGIEMRYRYGSRGDRWPFTRTEVLRQFPFPEPEGIPYLPESLVWDQIAQAYRARFVNEALYTVHPGEPGRLTDRRARMRQAPGLWQLHRHNLSLAPRWFRASPLSFLKSGVNYARFSLHLGMDARTLWHGVDPGLPRALAIASLPAGAVFWAEDHVLRLVGRRTAARG